MAELTTFDPDEALFDGEPTYDEVKAEVQAGIAKTVKGIIQTGAALAYARDNMVYKEHFDTWEAYVRDEFGMARSTSRQWIHAATAAKRIRAQRLDPPTSRRALYELHDVEEDDLPEVFEKAEAFAEEAGSEAPTIEHYKRAVGACGEEAFEKDEEDAAPEPVPDHHPAPSVEGFLADYRAEFGTDNSGVSGDGAARGDAKAATIDVNPEDVVVMEGDHEEDFWSDVAGDHAEAMLLAVPFAFDPTAYFKEELEENLSYYATPVGLPKVKSVGYLLKIIENPEQLAADIYESMPQPSASNRPRGYNSKDDYSDIDWANQTTNPVTGCRHSCHYCYARHQAEGNFTGYDQGFHPTYHPARLKVFDMDVDHTDDPRDSRIFIDSMSDLMGKWVPQWVIRSVLSKVSASDWTAMLLTKFPGKFRGGEDEEPLDVPSNLYLGVTVDGTETHPNMVEDYIKDFREADCKTWISAEPMLGPIEFTEGFLRDYIDMVVVGARQYNDGRPDEEPDYGRVRTEDGKTYQQPPFADVMRLSYQAKSEGCDLYWKSNLEWPEETT